MSRQTLDGADRTMSRQTSLKGRSEQLPKRARASEGRPIHQDHCFARVILDTVFEDEWYDRVDGRPASRQLSPNTSDK